MSTRRLCGREQPQACAADDDVAPHLPLLAPPPRLLPDARPPARPGALLKAGADPLARNAAGQMPLHAAAEAGEVAALHDLLRGAVRAWAPAAGAAAAGERRRAGRGASTGAAELRSAMPAAAEAGRRLPGPRLRGLRELSADAAGRTPLHAAAASPHRAPPGSLVLLSPGNASRWRDVPADASSPCARPASPSVPGSGSPHCCDIRLPAMLVREGVALGRADGGDAGLPPAAQAPAGWRRAAARCPARQAARTSRRPRSC